MKFLFVEEGKLNGDFDLATTPSFTTDSFLDNSYQTALEQNLKDRIGFHAFFVRLRNQLNYSFFDKVNTYGVIKGRKNMMIPKSYIESYYGLDYVGEAKLDEFTNELKYLQDKLSERGIAFMIMIPPGKASIYPERIPENERPRDTVGPTNYEGLIRLSAQKGINYLDLRAYLMSMKGKTETQIFPNYSVHWSGNSVSLVSDTLLGFIRNRLKLNVPYLFRHQGHYTVDNYWYTDYDIGESMNLLWHVAEDSLYYPNIEFVYRDRKAPRPAMLGCGDSFFQSFKGFFPILDSSFSQQSKLLYYNKFIDWPHRYYNMEVLSDYLDFSVELNKIDLVILEMTDENIKKLGYGFTKELKAALDTPYYSEEQIKRMNEIAESPETIEKASRFHQMSGYTLDEMKRAIAKKQVTALNVSDDEYERMVKEKMEEIKNSPEWFEKVKKQAAEKGISLEQNMRENAEYVVNLQLEQ